MSKQVPLFVQLKTIKVKIANNLAAWAALCIIFEPKVHETRLWPKLACKKVISDVFNTSGCLEGTNS